MSKDFHRVIGIDLGTTYSAVAVFDRYTEKAVVLPNPDDPKSPMTTPSVISLHPQTRKVIVGRPAKNNLPHDPSNTIVEIKREMGEEFRPETLQKFLAEGVFRARDSSQEGDPVHVRLDGKWYKP